MDLGQPNPQKKKPDRKPDKNFQSGFITTIRGARLLHPDYFQN